jgi:hypothetical protein
MDYEFTLTGTTPLLMHADDVEAADRLKSWRTDPKNKSVSVPGDDRSPPWTWQTYLYTDGTYLTMPQECLMAALRSAGSKIAAKGKSTFKALSQSGLLIGADHCELTNNGKRVRLADVAKLWDEPYNEQLAVVRRMGFDLMSKRARVGKAKHVRVRAKFDAWQVRGTVMVSEPAITVDVLKQLFELAGRFSGLGDWRPSAPEKPGPFGMFSAAVKPLTTRRAAG